MKTFRAHTSFIPESVVKSSSREIPAVVLPKTDYEAIDTNQAFGLYIKIQTPHPEELHSDGTYFQKIYISPKEIEQYGEVVNSLTFSEIKKILNNISFADSCVDFNWGWEISEINGQYSDETEPISKGDVHGFLINTTFTRPDTNTGVIGVGRGRRMWIEATASETSIVMTAWVCVELIVKHELMENYLYNNIKILNPHKTIQELAYPEIMQTSK